MSLSKIQVKKQGTQGLGPFMYEPRFGGILVCVVCQTCVLASGVSSHLAKKHEGIAQDLSYRRSVGQNVVAASQPLALTRPQLPPFIETPIQHLPVYRGYICTTYLVKEAKTCYYSCKELVVMQRHCKEHRENLGEQIRQAVAEIRSSPPMIEEGNHIAVDSDPRFPQYERVELQQPFHSTSFGNRLYVAIAKVAEQIAEKEADTDAATQCLPFNEFLQQGILLWQNAKKHAEANRPIGLTQNALNFNSWLARTRWQSFVAEADRKKVLALLRPANTPFSENSSAEFTFEQKLSFLSNAFKCCAQRSFDVCVPETAGWASLEVLASKHVGSSNEYKPFLGSFYQPETRLKYIRQYWQAICYICRRHDAGDVPDLPAQRLTTRQSNALDHLIHSCRPESPWPDNDSLMLEFIMSLIDHKIGDNEFDSPLVGALSALGLNKQWQTQKLDFQEPNSYTPLLSSIVTLSRAFVLYSVFSPQRMQCCREGIKGKWPPIADRVRSLVFKTMTLHGSEAYGDSYPMNWVYRLRAYGRKLSSSSGWLGSVEWRENQQLLVVGDTSISMTQLRDMVHRLTDMANTLLQKDLLFVNGPGSGIAANPSWRALPELDLSQLSDDLSRKDFQWNFLQHAQNESLSGHQSWLWEYIAAEPTLRRRIFNEESFKTDTGPSRATMFNSRGVSEYLGKVKEFKSILLVLAQLTSGQPARGTELLSIQFRNSDSNSLRNLLICDGCVVLATRYHKGLTTTRQTQAVFRFLPDEVGRLFVFFLWLVQPFLEAVHWNMYDELITSNYIWDPAAFRTKEYKDIMQEDEGQPLCEEPAGDDDSDNSSEGDQSGDEIDGKEGNSSSVQAAGIKPRDSMYDHVGQSDGVWDSLRVSNTIKRLTTQCIPHLGNKMGSLRLRHVHIAIARQHLCKETQDIVAGYLNPKYQGLQRQQFNNVFDGQANHTSAIAGSYYARSELENYGNVPWHVRQAFERASTELHKFLGFPSELARRHGADDSHLMDKTLGFRPSPRTVRARRLKAMSAQKVLEMVLRDKSAKFRCDEQQKALQAVLDDVSPILIVLPTGGGKTIMIEGPAFALEDGVTVVVVPLIALRRDLSERCRSRGIACVEWDPDHQADGYRVVLVTPEAAVGSKFVKFLAHLRSKDQLDRIVIDECHRLLADSSYRDSMKKVKGLIRTGEQLVMLSATLSPAQQGELAVAVGVSEASLVVHRAGTRRPNISYALHIGPAEDHDQWLSAYIVKARKQGTGRVIIYCHTRRRCDEVGKLLNCPTYYSNSGTEEQKQDVITRFISGEVSTLVASSALSDGLHVDEIIATIHDSPPQTIEAFMQQSGRAGRNGCPAYSIVMVKQVADFNGRVRIDNNPKRDESMDRFLQVDAVLSKKRLTCRRQVMHAYLDGEQDSRPCRDNENKCDICRPQPCPNKLHQHERHGQSSLPQQRSKRSAADAGHCDLASRSSKAPRFAIDTRQASGVLDGRKRLTGISLPSVAPLPLEIGHPHIRQHLAPKHGHCQDYSTEFWPSGFQVDSSPAKRTASTSIETRPSQYSAAASSSNGHPVAIPRAAQLPDPAGKSSPPTPNSAQSTVNLKDSSPLYLGSAISAQTRGSQLVSHLPEEADIIEVLDLWGRSCILCIFEGRGLFSHPWRSCPQSQNSARLAAGWPVNRRHRPDEYRVICQEKKVVGCWHCFLPQPLCNSWQRKPGTNDGSCVKVAPSGQWACDYEDLLLDICYIIHTNTSDARCQQWAINLTHEVVFAHPLLLREEDDIKFQKATFMWLGSQWKTPNFPASRIFQVFWTIHMQYVEALRGLSPQL